jgi:hypothetical protein
MFPFQGHRNIVTQPVKKSIARSYHPALVSSFLPRTLNPATDLRVLLLNIVLGTSLLRLPNIMLLLSLQLRIPITSDTSDCTTNGTSNPVCDSGTEIIELALGFLAFSFGVLLSACALKILHECQRVPF